jgi:tetratricopeptide (TPR) repeat protein
MLGWFNTRKATELGAELADQYLTGVTAGQAAPKKKAKGNQGNVLEGVLRRADSEIRQLQLNFFKRAKLANTFKWRLLENGVERQVADEITQTLVMHVSLNRGSLPAGATALPDLAAAGAVSPRRARELRDLGNVCISREDYDQALAVLHQLVKLKPRDADAWHNLGFVFSRKGRLLEAQECYSRAIAVRPNFASAHGNLGNVLRVIGRVELAERSLRRALKLNPSDEAVRCGLGEALIVRGLLSEAQTQFRKVLKSKPRYLDALIGLGQIAAMEGRFAEAEELLKQALQSDPDSTSAWAHLARLRKMTRADAEWIERVKALAERVSDPIDEANLRYALGKYYDDVAEYDSAFANFDRANSLLKPLAKEYPREAHESFIDDVIRSNTREAIAAAAATGGSDSRIPVLVTGMPRSGTSLVEQIIASHPMAFGAGELSFWTAAVKDHEEGIRKGTLSEPVRKKLAAEFLSELARHSTQAQRIIDKAVDNTEYLGLIHTVFPQARFIYVRRDPIDTCLSCYFQQFSTGLSFTLDLERLVHYYRQFHRVVAHWRKVLPADVLLEVPYEELVADPETWTRRIIDFVGLEWDERCLSSHSTDRRVATASAWQVRQKIYRGSVARWRHYAKHIGPLESLRELN